MTRRLTDFGSVGNSQAQYVRVERNRGLAGARNVGSHAEGQYMRFWMTTICVAGSWSSGPNLDAPPNRLLAADVMADQLLAPREIVARRFPATFSFLYGADFRSWVLHCCAQRCFVAWCSSSAVVESMTGTCSCESLMYSLLVDPIHRHLPSPTVRRPGLVRAHPLSYCDWQRSKEAHELPGSL